MTSFSRRNFLTAAAAGSAALAVDPLSLASGAKAARASEGGFSQGVAAGQPGRRGITLWTRVDGLERNSTVGLEIARDRDFRRVIHASDVVARKQKNFTVNARVAGRGLEPGEEYFYRFSTRRRESPVGRFRTSLPPDSRRPVRIGFFSCQDYESGFYTAHEGLADEDLDMVVCLGDYVYERSFDDNPIRRDRTGENSDGEVETIGAYRDKYALYHSDHALRRLRQSHALMAIWDDHEVEDNYAAWRPGEATLDRDLAFPQRRRNGYRAFFEHMPRIRDADERNRIYGSLRLGANAELLLLDQRQYRDDQPCGDQIGSANCPEAFAGGRTMLGERQKRWLKRRLERSPATWKVVANQVMMMALDFPLGNPLNPDQWDGYKAERRELAEFIRARGVEDVAFVTGDIHVFFAGQVTPTGRDAGPAQAVATEFVGGSMTSKGIFDALARDELQRELLADLSDSGVRTNNPHIVYSNQELKGYGVLEARPYELRVEYRSPRSVAVPRSAVSTLQRFRVQRGRPRVEVLGAPLGGFPN